MDLQLNSHNQLIRLRGEPHSSTSTLKRVEQPRPRYYGSYPTRTVFHPRVICGSLLIHLRTYSLRFCLCDGGKVAGQNGDSLVSIVIRPSKKNTDTGEPLGVRVT